MVVRTAPRLADAVERRLFYPPAFLAEAALHRGKECLHRPVEAFAQRGVPPPKRRVVIPPNDVSAGVGVICSRSGIPVHLSRFAKARTESANRRFAARLLRDELVNLLEQFAPAAGVPGRPVI